MVALHRLRRWRDDRLAAAARWLDRSRGGRFVLDVLLAAWAVARGFRGEKISLRASALTYISIFALAPLLTVALALVELFGQNDLHAQVRAFLLDLLAPGIAEESAAMLDQFLSTASTTAAGSVGFAVLIVSAGTLLKNLDTSLHEIWNVRRRRPPHVRLAIYAAVLVLGPALLALSLAGMGVLRAWVTPVIPFSGDLLTAAGALVAVAGFTFMYRVGPNVEVRFRSAFAGGLVAGLTWDVAKHVYGGVAAGLFRASPIWGSLTAVPLFLTWIYVSWLLLLFGARLAYAVQYTWFRAGVPDLATFPRGEALIAARLAALLAEPSSDDLSVRNLPRALGLPQDVLGPVLERLVRAGVVRVLPGGLVQAGRPLDELTLADTALAVGAGSGSHATGFAMGGQVGPPPSAVEALFQQAEEAFLEQLRRVRWDDLPALNRRAGTALLEEEDAPGTTPANAAVGQKP